MKELRYGGDNEYLMAADFQKLVVAFYTNNVSIEDYLKFAVFLKNEQKRLGVYNGN